MNFIQWVKQLFKADKEGVRLNQDPQSKRLSWISDEEAIREGYVRDYKAWFSGNSDLIDNRYRERAWMENRGNPIYNRGQNRYFHALSEKERKIKTVHTGVPRASIITMCNVIGNPKIKCDEQEIWDKIAEENNFASLLNQRIRPLTMVTGWGATKPIFNPKVSEYPIIAYYDGEFCKYETESDKVLGIIFQDYFKFQGKTYALAETRSADSDDSKMSYKLFEYNSKGEGREVPLNTIPLLADYESEMVWEGYPKMLCQTFRYLHDPDNPDYGLSFFAGKTDIMDDMDMLASIESLTEMQSSPITYYPTDKLSHNKDGKRVLPNNFNRVFIEKPSAPNANGQQDSAITIDQPNLDFARYHNALIEKTKLFLNGFMAPATMGIEIARKDNAEAQREKEKVTIMTRDNVMASERKSISDLVNACLFLYHASRGEPAKLDYNVSVTYDEFANPSMESKLPILGRAWSNGEISTKRYVEAMYPDETQESRDEEMAWLDSNKAKDTLTLGDYEE